MEDTKEIIELLIRYLLPYGIAGFLLIALILLIHDPDRAMKLKALIFEPIFRLTKWGSKQYIGSKVSSQVTDFLKHQITKNLSNKDSLRVKVKWVTSASDPVLKRDGTVILRMRETPDQTRNVFVATQLVLPFMLFSSLRNSLDKSVQTAIDLTILNKMALKLGPHAKAVFQRYFLAPETEADDSVGELFAHLVELDSGGLFVSIFLEELETLADAIFVRPDFVNRSAEVGGLLDYLLTVVRRRVGEEIELDHHSEVFHIGLIIVAKSVVAEAMGIGPYIARVQKKLRAGCSTIYLLAYAHKQSFLPRVVRGLDQEDRVIIEKEAEVNIDCTPLGSESAKIVKLRRNDVFADDIFAEKLRLSGIKLGDTVEGVITDVSQEMARVTVTGLNGSVSRHNASWQTVINCCDVFTVGDKHNFRVKAVRKDIGELQLSARFPATDLWKTTGVPGVGDVIQMEVVRDYGDHYLCRLATGLELALPKAEVSWLVAAGDIKSDLSGRRERAMIYEVDEERRVLRCSLRRLEQDPWPKISQRFPRGTRLRGTVIKTTPYFVHVDLGDGITGGVPRASMLSAGFEYSAFEKNVVAGQGLDVVVKDVLPERQVIRLDLQRNIPTPHKVPKVKSKKASQ